MTEKRQQRRDTTTGFGLSKLGTGTSSSSSPARGSGTHFYALSYRVLEVIHQELEKLLAGTAARCALVIDRTGCIMASAGNFEPINPSTMGATAAATIAALNTMVSRASSPEVSVKFYGSEIDRIHFTLIEERLILCLLYGKEAESKEIRTHARHFAATVSQEIDEDRSRARETGGKDVLESVNYIENKLDELFMDKSGSQDERPT